MRVRVLLALLLLAPVARAGALELDGPRLLEAPAARETVTFEVPFQATQDGAAYAKLLPTPGNAVNDGSGPNASGWRVRFALARADGAVEPLGERADGAPTAFAPVAAGEALRLLVTVQPPDEGGSGTQKVHVALAYRAPGASPTASGGSLDEARAVTLLLHFPLPAGGVDGVVTPTPDVGPVPATGGGPAAAPPQVVVVRESAPWWLLALASGVLLLALATLAAALVVLGRASRMVPAAAPAVRVAVQEPPADQSPGTRYPR